MARSVLSNAKVYKIQGDFFTKFKLEAKEVIDSGMCGDIVLAISLEKPDVRRVVKKFNLLDEENNITNQETFEAEVRFMQACEHPYLTECLVAGACKDYLAICMYYYPRGTLSEYMGNLSVDLSELCVIQVACALRYLHEEYLVHMDVKLDNVFMDAEFNAILGDFGLAVELEPQQKTVERSMCGGTPCYFPPERKGAADNKELDPYKMDAYCLGVVLWALLMERDPDESVDYYFEARRKPNLPTHLRELLLKLLDKCPDRRITVADFLKRLRRDSVHRRVIDSY
ncbi:unnamed protein product [Candidula unifasciata]|uniref:Protein kinase domain-containing protein n=1 Tax=Candidula unifasciata TaxID=100452 RepID=A0A8S3YP02_9EUPU|nr:unnamed protein product [Candidula unifasciata]